MAPLSFGTNIASLQTQGRLSEATSGVQKSIQRLASGERINNASDDAAGLAVSSVLNAQQRIFSQAIRNVSDGQSALSIAEGTLTQLSSITQRQQELAEEAANGTLQSSQRTALQQEADQLTQEFDRLVNTTSFNGQQIFNTSLSALRIQAGTGIINSLATVIGANLIQSASGSNGGSYNLSGPVNQVVNLNLASENIPSNETHETTKINVSTPSSGWDANPGSPALDEEWALNLAGGSITHGAQDYFTLQGPNGQSTDFYFVVDGETVSDGGSAPNAVEVDVSSSDFGTDALNVDIQNAITGDDPGGSTWQVTDNGAYLLIDYVGNVNVRAPNSSDYQFAFGPDSLTQAQAWSPLVNGAGASNLGYFNIWNGSQEYTAWFNNGGESNPTPGGSISVPINTGAWNGDSAATAANIIGSALQATGAFTYSLAGSTLSIVAKNGANATNSVNVLAAAVDSSFTHTDPTGPTGYFQFFTPTTSYYAWYSIDGYGTDPALSGSTGIQVNVGASDNAATIYATTLSTLSTYMGSHGNPVTVAAGGGLTLNFTNNGTPGSIATPYTLSNLPGVTANVTQAAGGYSNIATDTLTIANHGLTTGTQVSFSTTGSLPGGLSAATPYYVINTGTNTLKLATSAANANAGTAIDLTTFESGNATMTATGNAASATFNATNVDLSSAAAAQNSLTTLNSQFQRVTNELSSIGAFQSRLSVATNVLQTSNLETAAASSRITSVDVADESSNLVREEILQQAAASVIAQANQGPELLLKLLE